MLRSLSATLAVLAGAGALLLTLAAPTAAYTVRGTGLYASFVGGSMDGTGIFMIDRTGSNDPRLHGAFVGLLPYMEQDAVFRTIGCAGTPTKANRVLKVHEAADQNGNLTYDTVLSAQANLDAVKSIWIVNDGGERACRAVDHFVRVATGDVNGDGVLGLKAGAGEVLFESIVSTTSSGATVNVVGYGLNAGHDYSLRYAMGRCGHSQGKVRLSHSIDPTSSGAFSVQASAGVSMDKLGSVRSIRIVDKATGKLASCAQAIIMATTEGD